jgi:capsular exopolysaccharide synthesis family protein
MAIGSPSEGQSRGPGLDESSADVRRYMAAISRSRALIALTVAIITGAVLILSLLLPKTYESVARISLDEQSGVLGTLDAESTQRRLATLETLLTSQEVLDRAAQEVPGETEGSLEDSVESSVDEEANIINVVGSDGEAERSAQIAQAVADSFLAVQADQQRDRLEAARDDLVAQIERLSASSAPDAEVQIQAIQERLSQVAVDIQLAGSELQLAQPAEVPSAPATPRPVRNTVLAFFGSLFLGILLALARDQLRPGLRGPRELSRLAGGVPVLATIPYVRRGMRRRQLMRSTAAEHEAYQTLRASIRGLVSPGRESMILVTSAMHGEGKTTVTARLGRALAQAGYNVLLISADLRVPSMHRLFDVPLRPGLSESIQFVERAQDIGMILQATVRDIAPAAHEGTRGYKLDLLTSGSEPEDPSRLLSSEAADRFFDQVRESGYDYVLVDSPPLLGIADVQALAPHVDHVLMVGRLDTLTPDGVIDAQDIFARLDTRPMGLVVIGAKTEASPYHYMQRGTGPRTRGPERPPEPVS